MTIITSDGRHDQGGLREYINEFHRRTDGRDNKPRGTYVAIFQLRYLVPP
ncbi:hypothetical protein ABZ897_10745 [Nonomuraea sp. NPDC046802]